MEQSSAHPEHIENIRIANDQAAPLTLVFEPWFETYDIPPGEYIIISSKGPIGDSIEITIGAKSCIVWGWPGSSMVVLHNGDVVIDVRELKMPSTPVPSLRQLGESLWANVKEAELDQTKNPKAKS